MESGTETEVKPQTEVESQTEIESELQTEVELQAEVENETLESESETEVPMTETEVPETTAASEPQTQVPETTASESETESTEQLESDTTEEESSIVASLIDSIKGLFTPVEVYAAEEHITYNAGEGNGAEAVSYTHLDVYKRQVLDSPAAPPISFMWEREGSDNKSFAVVIK